MKIDLATTGALLWFILKLALKTLLWISLGVVFTLVFVLGAIVFFVLALLVQNYIAYVFIGVGVVMLLVAAWVCWKDNAEARARTKPPP